MCPQTAITPDCRASNSVEPGNLFSGLPRSTASEEDFCTLWQQPGLRIERIVSTGQCSPPDFWYDQAEGEWILLLQGAARLRLAGEDCARELQPGDYLNLPAHCRHRVEWTDPRQITIWLAVFYPAMPPVNCAQNP